MMRKCNADRWIWCLAVVILPALLVSLVASNRAARESTRLGISSSESLQQDELTSNKSMESIETGDENDAPAVNKRHRSSTSNQHSEDGSSRGVGGIEADVFPWLIIFWINPRETKYLIKKDGYLTGYGLRIKNHYFISQLETPTRGATRDSFWSPHDREKHQFKLPDFVQYRPTQTIDVSVGRQWPEGTPGKGLGGYSLFHVKTFEPSFVAIFHMTYRNGNDTAAREDAASLTADQLPVLQTDINAKDDCFVYTYASPWEKENLNFNAPSLIEQQNKRRFSKWPVKLIKPGIISEFGNDRKRMKENEDEGAICKEWSDVGAPIMCGTNPPKLSYIVIRLTVGQIWYRNDSRNCNSDVFWAKRLADNYEILKQPETLNEGLN